jgi:hypothetical protein
MRMHNENNKGGFEGPQVPYEYTMPDGTTEIVGNTGYNDKPNPRGPMEIGDDRSFNNSVLASIYVEVKPVKWLHLQNNSGCGRFFQSFKILVPCI